MQGKCKLEVLIRIRGILKPFELRVEWVTRISKPKSLPAPGVKTLEP